MREMQIKTTVRYHFTTIRMAITIKKEKKKEGRKGEREVGREEGRKITSICRM